MLQCLFVIREEEMSLEHQVRLLSPAVLLVGLKGILDAGTAVAFEMGIAGHLKSTELKTVILDVPELSFVSSSGLRVFMLIIKNLSPKKGKLYMVGAGDQLAGLVKMSGMTKWIHMRDSIQECER